jgi:ribose/xylose/arabinose/galactoside ABC-type transport system permease subunit
MPSFAGILLGVGSGALVGLANGILCAFLNFSPIIVTLGMLSVLRGVTLLINPIEVSGLGDTFFAIGNGGLLGMPILLIVVFAVFLLSAGFLSLTVWGRYVFAIGVNPQAAFLAALPVRAVLLGLYIATGSAAGLSGVLLVARLDGASPGSLGLQMELQALTIILLGGVAFAGGRGRILGVFIAWVFLGVLDNGLTLLNVPPFVQLVASGAALVFAASLDALGTFLGPRLDQRRRVAEQVSRAEEVQI